MESNSKGLLYPRVALSSTSSASPLSAHIKGMVVYDTATVAASGITPGLYYNDGTQWVRVAQESNPDWLKMSDGSPAGNADDQYVMGSIGVGQSTSSAKLTVSNDGNTTLPVLQLKAPFTGSTDDSLLTWNPTDSTVRKIPVSAIASLVMNNLCATSIVSSSASANNNAQVSQDGSNGSWNITLRISYTTNPVDTTWGASATMSITATGAAPTYQWYGNNTASTTGGTAISGATSASYTVTLTGWNGILGPGSTTYGPNNTILYPYYYCVVSGMAGCSLAPVTSALFNVGISLHFVPTN